MEEKYYIKYIDDPYLNKLLAPENNLYRPRISWLKLSMGTMILVSMVVFLIIGNKYLSSAYGMPSSDIPVIVFWTILIMCVFAKQYLIFAIMFYQRYAKSTTRLKCCCSPSCSQYAIIALRKYGSIIGLYLSIKHCIRCAPPGIHEFP